MNIIAEVGLAHDGSFGNALKLVDMAKKCGADTIKFQTHISEAESLPDAPNPHYFKDESRIDYFKRTSFTIDQWKQLKGKADQCEVQFLSSPFSLEAVDLLEEVGIFAYKIPSGEVTNLPLLEKITEIGKPVFLSSGMSDWKELDTAVDIFRDKCELTVMQCSSAYPCPPEQVGLNVITEIRKRYHCKVGFSDHTLGYAASLAAAALGATVIEKHFTFSRCMYGSDAKHSMEPDAFSKFCSEIQDAWSMLKNPIEKNDTNPYREMKKIFQKSIVASCDIPEGTRIEMKHLAFKKSGDGLTVSSFRDILGKKTSRELKKNDRITFNDLS